MDLVLYRQATGPGDWKIYRNSGLFNARWRLVFQTHDEGKADMKWKKLYDKWRQGGIRLIDPEGKVTRDVYAPPMRWRLPF